MQKKFKILYIDYPLDPPGGGQMSLLLLLKNLDRSRFEPVVFVPFRCGFTAILEKEGISHEIVPITYMYFRIAALKPDIIHCNAPTARVTFAAGLCAKTLKIPFIWHVRVTESAGWKDKVIAGLSTRVIVTSDAVRHKMTGIGIDSKLIKIHNGVDIEEFNPDIDKAGLREHFNLDEKDFVVGAIGRLDDWKGHRYFIETAKLVLRQFPQSRFIIVGDGPEKNNLEAQIKELGLEGRVILAGFRTDIPELMSLFDVLVQPSEVEPFGRTVIEAMACGKPVVSTDAGGPREIIENNVDGILLPLDSNKFADAVVKLAKNRDLYASMASSARKKAVQKFDIKKQIGLIEGMYMDLLEKTAVFSVCNICGSGNKKIVEWADARKVVRCLGCGFVYLAPLPGQEALTGNYQEEYFKPWVSAMSAKRKKIFAKRWSEIKISAQVSSEKGKILDVGCGPGEFLDFAKRDGWDAFGIEISAFASSHAVKEYALNVFNGKLEDAKFDNAMFDVVTIWHVLEHVPDPTDTLKEVNRIIKPGGLLVIAVPNLNNYIYRLVYMMVKLRKMRLFTEGERELHVSFFSSKSLRNLLEKTGFEIKKETVDTGRSLWAERLIDSLSFVIFALTKRNLGIAIEMHAIKKYEKGMKEVT